MKNVPAPAVVLLSGGLDSATCVAIAQQSGFSVYAISFRYGQRHSIELTRAAAVAKHFSIQKHAIIDIDLAKLGGSALTDMAIDVPKHDTAEEIGTDIPLTYVPARNTVFLSYALAWAEVLDSNDIFIGVNALDYSGYPDCRPEYIQAYEMVANLATKRGVSGEKLTIHAPLIHMTKGEIIRKGIDLGVDYSLTVSCYDPTPEGKPCRRCDSCLLRARGFAQAGISDPALQETQ
ncbi:MAG: 7-cyano-7-deazaguanine synthase QueC [Pirellula sp.]|jgi:7-cyano-7-deazaguanine synthase|nr:7-cyano-7-deazaguanine synthase QueC [Pirellula sp.]